MKNSATNLNPVSVWWPAILLGFLLLGLTTENRFVGIRSGHAESAPPKYKQQYRVVKSICTENCNAATNFEGWETQFINDILGTRSFSGENEQRVSRLVLTLQEPGDCYGNRSCDRIAVNFGKRALIIKCGIKGQLPQEDAKECYANQTRCMGNMLKYFAQRIQAHDELVHQGH